MTTVELLKIVRERGLKIEIKDGQPVIKGERGKHKISGELLEVLARHRERIIKELTDAQQG